MKCEECRPWLEGYVECELDEPLSEEIFAHLDACAACAGACEELRREQEVYRRYFLAAEPPSALWVNFQESMARENEGRSLSLSIRFRRLFIDVLVNSRRRPAYAAAFAMLAVGTTLALMGYRASRQDVPQAEGVVRTSDDNNPRLFPSPPDARDALDAERERQAEVRIERTGSDRAARQANGVINRHRKAPTEVGGKYVKRANQKLETANARALLNDSVRGAERQYLAAITVLLRDVNRGRRRLDAGAMAQLSQSLADLDRTINDTRRAVRERPNDPLAVMYMTVAYEKKIEVLRQLVGS